MERNRTHRSKKRLLLNAEPFGFGPTAAIASFFPFLRERFHTIGYIGKRHTLDLQRPLPYDEVIDLTSLTEEEELKVTKAALNQYDVFFTALDFQLASLARELGTVTAIYDPLTWYWRTVPEIIATCDLYIAQQFLGVADRMEQNPRQFAQARMVSPIVEQHARVQPDTILINLGGLQNPFWSVDDATQYARMMLQAIVPQLPKQTLLVIATSSAVARQIPEWPVRSYSHTEMENILKKTRYAFMTPGLGNIYTAAAYDLPTVWLPPANDSQGQQLELLVQYGCADGTVDWKDLLQTGSIEYASEQSIVLTQITESVHQLHTQQQLQQRLSERIAQEATRVASLHSSNLTQLLTKFGHGGASQVAVLTHQLAEGAL